MLHQQLLIFMLTKIARYSQAHKKVFETFTKKILQKRTAEKFQEDFFIVLQKIQGFRRTLEDISKIRQNQKQYKIKKIDNLQICRVYFKNFTLDIKIKTHLQQYFIKDIYAKNQKIIYDYHESQLYRKKIVLKDPQYKAEEKTRKNLFLQFAIKKIAGQLGLSSKIISQNGIDIHEYSNCFVYQYEYFKQFEIDSSNKSLIQYHIDNSRKILNALNIMINNYGNIIEYDENRQKYVFRHFQKSYVFPYFSQQHQHNDIKNYKEVFEGITSDNFGYYINNPIMIYEEHQQTEIINQNQIDQHNSNNQDQKSLQQNQQNQQIYKKWIQKSQFLQNSLFLKYFPQLTKKMIKNSVKFKIVLKSLISGLISVDPFERIGNFQYAFKLCRKNLQKVSHESFKFLCHPVIAWYRIQYAKQESLNFSRAINEVTFAINVLSLYYLKQDQIMQNNLITLLTISLKQIKANPTKQLQDDILSIIEICQQMSFFDSTESMKLFKLKTNVIGGYFEFLMIEVANNHFHNRDRQKMLIYKQRSKKILSELDLTQKYNIEQLEIFYYFIVLKNWQPCYNNTYSQNLFKGQDKVKGKFPQSEPYIIMALIISGQLQNNLNTHITLKYLEYKLDISPIRYYYREKLTESQVINAFNYIKQDKIRAYLYLVNSKIFIYAKKITASLFWLIEALEVIKVSKQKFYNLLGLVFLQLSQLLSHSTQENSRTKASSYKQIANKYLYEKVDQTDQIKVIEQLEELVVFKQLTQNSKEASTYYRLRYKMI